MTPRENLIVLNLTNESRIQTESMKKMKKKMKLNDEKVKQIEDTMKLKVLQMIQMKEDMKQSEEAMKIKDLQMNQMKEKLKKLEDTIEGSNKIIQELKESKSALNEKMGKQSSSEMGDTIFQDYSASATKEQRTRIADQDSQFNR